MPVSQSRSPRIAVVKIGGSILVDRGAYQRAASYVRRQLRRAPEERLLLVVSAENGLTDALLAQAREIAPAPDAAPLDLLWSTGELRSVALLAMHLHRLGVRAAALNVHETGLILRNGRRDASGVELHSRRLLSALLRHPAVVVPGFLARRPWGTIVSLGRGGSDLTAVVLAAGLRASRCELVKDVPGYFDKDPNQHADARHVPCLSFERALAMADEGCDLVQRLAIETAASASLPLMIRSLGDDTRCTRIEPPRRTPATPDTAPHVRTQNPRASDFSESIVFRFGGEGEKQ